MSGLRVKGIMLLSLVSGYFRGMGLVLERAFFPGLTPGSVPLHTWILLFVSSFLSFTFSQPPRPWAPRGTCPLKWSRLQGARCRACRAPSRKTANASWLSFLVWSVMSGLRSTLTTGLLPRTQPRADSSCQFPPSKKSPNQNRFHCNPTLFSISQKF